MIVEIFVEDLVEKFEGWISGSNNLIDLLGSFSSMPAIVVFIIVLIGAVLLVSGRKLFLVFYSVFWALTGVYLGYIWGENLQAIYMIELMIIVGVILPLLASKARSIFVFVMVLFGTGFFLIYVLESLGAYQNLSVLEPPFLLAGALLGWLAVKFMNYIMIVSTSTIGALMLTLALNYYIGNRMDLLIMLLVFSVFALFGIFLQVDLYLRASKRKAKGRNKKQRKERKVDQKDRVKSN